LQYRYEQIVAVLITFNTMLANTVYRENKFFHIVLRLSAWYWYVQFGSYAHI